MSSEKLIRHCAPTMARLKTGSMFNWSFSSRDEMLTELRELNLRLQGKGLRVIPLRQSKGSVLVYVYRPKMLEKDLRNGLAEQLLQECGYSCGNANLCLARLIQRLRTQQDFPHEVGLFLGYPPEDVDGFMHRKEECKLCGLWKVYEDVENAQRQFIRCKRCTEVYLQRYAEGFPLEKLAVAGA